jgi:calmodulin
VGVYQGSTRSILGANEHTLQFKDGVKTLKLRDLRCRVVQGQEYAQVKRSHSEAASRAMAQKFATELRKACVTQSINYRQCFEQMDVNGDGILDAQELKIGIQQLFGGQVSNETLRQLFAVVDADGDTEISWEEFAAVLKRANAATQLAKEVRRLLSEQMHNEGLDLRITFQQFDKNRDGVLSASELMQGLRQAGVQLTRTDEQQLMAVLDHDGNGEIDYDEFVALLDAEPSRMAMHGDREFPKGAYVEVEGHGVGVYQGSTRSILGANEHTLQFKDGVKTLKLRDLRCRVVQGQELTQLLLLDTQLRQLEHSPHTSPRRSDSRSAQPSASPQVPPSPPATRDRPSPPQLPARDDARLSQYETVLQGSKRHERKMEHTSARRLGAGAVGGLHSAAAAARHYDSQNSVAEGAHTYPAPA